MFSFSPGGCPSLRLTSKFIFIWCLNIFREKIYFLKLNDCIWVYFFFCLFRAAPMAYGDSQARGTIGAAAAGLHQKHSNAVTVTYTTAHGNAGSLTHWARPGVKPATSWFLVGFVSAAPRWELHEFTFELKNIFALFPM